MYHLQAMMDFTDKHDETIKYKKNQKIVVDEKRAFELFSSNNHLVKFLKKEEKELDNEKDELNQTMNSSKDSNIGNQVPEENIPSSQNQNPINDEYETMGFKKLQNLAEERGIDVAGVNKKADLIALLREDK